AGKELSTQRAAALKNAEAERRDLNKARDRAARLPKPRPLGDLSRALTAADKLGDITADIAKRTRALERKAKALNETIIGLVLGTDPVSVFRELAVPPEKTIVRYADLFTAAEREMTTAEDELQRLTRDMAECDRGIAALKATGDAATEDDLKAARHARDQ